MEMSIPIEVVDTDLLIMSAGCARQLAFSLEVDLEASMSKEDMVKFIRATADEKLKCAAWIRVLEDLAFKDSSK